MNIELVNVWYRYSRVEDWALRGISISFRSGEVIYIDGPNGSGKTTLLKIASLIYRPLQGSVLVDGNNFWNLDENSKTLIRRKVIYVHDKPILLRGTVLDNVAYGLHIRGVDRRNAYDTSMSILSVLGIDSLAHTPIQRLSTGQAQLVAIARALAIKPEILFLDEPFSNLDREKRLALISTLNQFRARGMGIVFSSHNADVMELGKHRRVVLGGGTIIDAYEVV
ncbi:MAG: ATP-binding cassette domain-containing protein [Ignisphaera sp.]